MNLRDALRFAKEKRELVRFQHIHKPSVFIIVDDLGVITFQAHTNIEAPDLFSRDVWAVAQTPAYDWNIADNADPPFTGVYETESGKHVKLWTLDEDPNGDKAQAYCDQLNRRGK